MVAGTFRREVTSTVLWLMNYKLKIKCIKATPYQLGEQLFLDLRQIIPIKEAEDYTIKMIEKSEEENITKNQRTDRHNVRLEFWSRLLKILKEEKILLCFQASILRKIIILKLVRLFLI